MTRDEIKAVWQLAAEVSDLWAPDQMMDWLTNPHPQFEGKSALDMIEAGRVEDLRRTVQSLAAGTYL